MDQAEDFQRREARPLISLCYAQSLEARGARLLILPADSRGQVSLPDLLQCLVELGVNSLMVEGGAQVLTSFLAQHLADLALITLAPIFVGGLPAVNGLLVSDGTIPVDTTPFPRLQDAGFKRLGDDCILWGRFVYSVGG